MQCLRWVRKIHAQFFYCPHDLEHELLLGLEELRPDGGTGKAIYKNIQAVRTEIIEIDEIEILQHVFVIRNDLTDFANQFIHLFW